MPFVTEEIWQHLPHTGESIMIAPYPEPMGEQDLTAEADFALIQEVVRGIRNARAEMEVPPTRRAR